MSRLVRSRKNISVVGLLLLLLAVVAIGASWLLVHIYHAMDMVALP